VKSLAESRAWGYASRATQSAPWLALRGSGYQIEKSATFGKDVWSRVRLGTGAWVDVSVLDTKSIRIARELKVNTTVGEVKAQLEALRKQPGLAGRGSVMVSNGYKSNSYMLDQQMLDSTMKITKVNYSFTGTSAVDARNIIEGLGKLK
jgi:hypothetical protein